MFSVRPDLVESLWLHGRAQCLVRHRETDETASVFDCYLLNSEMEALVRVEGLRIAHVQHDLPRLLDLRRFISFYY
jgi:hypothetical protein